jgi:dipeptidyl aminopeptidase/acylaminoacyl peptidase
VKSIVQRAMSSVSGRPSRLVASVRAVMARILAVFGILIVMDASVRAMEYRSPDGALTAVVVVGRGDDCEARISWRRTDGQIVLRKEYTSPGHQHGYCIKMASWTPDSQFFVYNLTNSGGHSPWHIPVHFFARRTMTVENLEDYIDDPPTGEKFSVLAPDVIEVTTTALPLDKHKPIVRRLNLGELRKRMPRK